jgi:type I restriction enzyme S subunit
MRKGWVEARLSDVVEKIGMGPFGSNIKISTFVPEGVPVISGNHLVNEILTEDSFNFVTVEHAERISGSIVWRGDLVLTHAGTVGQVSLIPSNSKYEKYVVSQRGFFIRPNSSLVKSEYLLLYLKYGEGQVQLLSNINRTGVPSLSQPVTFTKQMKVIYPPLDEQKRIVDVMSSINAYIGALHEQLNYALRAKSALLEKELQKNFSGARKVTLGEVLNISRGGSPRPIQNYLTTEDNGVNWIKIGDASSSTKYIYETEQKIKPEGLSKTRKVYPGDFLLSNSMSFGRPYIMRTEGCIHDGWLLLGDVSKHFDEDFLYNFLRSGYIQAQFASLAAGSGVKNLNIDVVSGVEIVLPSVSDQKKIAQFLNSFDELEFALEKALEKAVILRGAVLSDLLSGNHEIPASYDSLLGAA